MSGSRKGRPVTENKLSNARGNTRPQPPGGIEYKPTHCGANKADGSACSARPVKGTSMCIGHTRSKSGEQG